MPISIMPFPYMPISHMPFQGNIGDSRAIGSYNGHCCPLSFDHKPNRSDELKRIEVRIKLILPFSSPIFYPQFDPRFYPQFDPTFDLDLNSGRALK